MYKPGQWRAICDVCGFKFYSGAIKKRWDGLMVCDKDFELDHPQKYIKVREDKIATEWARPYNDTYIYTCFLYASFAYADLGEADCARADIATTPYVDAAQMKGGGTP